MSEDQHWEMWPFYLWLGVWIVMMAQLLGWGPFE